MIDIVVTLNFHRGSVTLARIARQCFVVSPVFFRLLQGSGRNLHQIRNGRAAADVALIHHVANTRAVKGITGLQQCDPAAVKRGLLLANSLQDGEVFFVMLQGIKEKTTGCQL
ncbi:hypothetical protein D3C85_1603190 [compost metagenome]